MKKKKDDTGLTHRGSGVSSSATERVGAVRKSCVFALIDCNNFFVACEKVFRPDLEGKPVVVLSSNDGCVVARSNEAKALSIPMAAPAFKYRHVFRQHGVVQFSANFELYGDFSRRITALLTSITPRIEIYSVDESFLDLSELIIKDYTVWALQVRSLILHYTGLPVSIGIAPTKTLAKLASDRAKKQSDLCGVLDLTGKNDTPKHLKAIQIEDVWGIGWRSVPKVRVAGLQTAYDLSTISPRAGRQLLGGIRGEQLVRELNGISCLPLEAEHIACKSIARTRTFGEDTGQFRVVEAAIASFVAQAAFRLRKSGQLTKRASLFLTTNKHNPGYHGWRGEVKLAMPSSDTGLLTRLLVEELGRLYDSHAVYHRAGVILYDFIPTDYLQTDLLGTVDVNRHAQSNARMEAVDEINSRFGKHKIRYAAEDLGNAWEPRRNLLSPRYTSSWEELANAKIQIY